MRRILGLAMALLLLCGCMQSVRLNDRAIVEAIAVDRVANGYKITLQAHETTGNPAGQQGGDNVVLEETGHTLTEAFTEASVSQGKQLFLGNSVLLLIGSETARGGLDEVLRYFNAIHRVNPTIGLALTDGDAGGVLRARDKNPLLTADGITDQLHGAWKSGFSVRGRLGDAVGALQSGQTALCLPLLSLTEEQSGEPRLQLMGAGIFRGEYLDQTIDRRAVRGYAWTQNRMESTSLVVEDERFGQLSAVTDTQRAKLSVEAVGDLLVFNIAVKVHSTALAERRDGTGGSAEERARIAALLQEREVQTEIEHLLDQTERRGYDVLGLSLLVRQKLPGFYEAHREDFGEVLRGSGYNVQVHCEIVHTGVARMEPTQ